MATVTLDDLVISSADWVEVTATLTGLVSTEGVIQNVSPGDGTVDIVFAGASAPTNKTGIRLWYGDSVQGNAAKVWARANDGTCTISASTV